MYLVHVYQYSACRTLDLAHSEFLEKLVLLSQGSIVVLELFQSLVLQQKHLLRILQILQHTPNSVAKKKREFSTDTQAKEVCLQLMVLLNCSHLLSNQKLTSELVAFLKMHSYQTILVLVHSENYLVLQNLYRSIQTKDRCCSPSLEKVKKHLSQIHQKKEQKLFCLVLQHQKFSHSPKNSSELSVFLESLRMHSYQTILVLVHSENYLVLQNRSPRIQKRDKCSSPLLEKVRSIRCKSTRRRNRNYSVWFYSTRNSCVCRRVIWNNCSIWNCWCTLCTILYRIGYIQKTIWCCGIVHCKSRRETDALLVYWRRKRDTHRELYWC